MADRAGELVLDSRLEEARRLGPWLEQELAAVADEAARGELELALVELVTNVIRHGHDDEPGHPIRLRLQLAEGLLRIEIRDRGSPMPPEALDAADTALDFGDGGGDDDGGGLDGLPVSGLGLGLVKAIVDRLDYASDAGGNLTTLEKRLAPDVA